MNAPLIMVIYDGINNSVFDGQVIQPLIAHRTQHPNQPILLISFERKHKTEFAKSIAQLQTHAIQLIVLKKYPLITRLPLLYACRQLHNILRTFAHYQLLVRGPLAGYIALHAHDTRRCTSLTIQARGLLAEEYIFSTRNITGLAAWYHAYKVRLLKRIEHAVYGTANTNPRSISKLRYLMISLISTVRSFDKLRMNGEENSLALRKSAIVLTTAGNLLKDGQKMPLPAHPEPVEGSERKLEVSEFQKNSTVQIQAVSTALKNYLINTYGTHADHITIANHDIPPRICPAQKLEWRAATRATLAIADTTHVYCYNGSAKAWQCPHETVAYFKQQHTRNPDSLLLILTQDIDVFTQIITQHGLSSTSYRIMHVAHAQIYHYLAACDTGIIMRDHTIINWTSRPTKILEYQSVGLTIAHNNSIGYLQEMKHSPSV